MLGSMYSEYGQPFERLETMQTPNLTVEPRLCPHCPAQRLVQDSEGGK